MIEENNTFLFYVNTFSEIKWCVMYSNAPSLYSKIVMSMRTGIFCRHTRDTVKPLGSGTSQYSLLYTVGYIHTKMEEESNKTKPAQPHTRRGRHTRWLMITAFSQKQKTMSLSKMSLNYKTAKQVSINIGQLQSPLNRPTPNCKKEN